MDEKNSLSPQVASILTYAGILLSLLGLYFIIIEGLIEPSLPRHRFDMTDVKDIALGIFFLLLGVGAIRFGKKKSEQQ